MRLSSSILRALTGCRAFPVTIGIPLRKPFRSKQAARRPCLRICPRPIGTADRGDAKIVTFDQPGIAARIAHHNTGIVTLLDKLSAPHLSALLGEVLSDPTYRKNACRIQEAIIKANGLSAAADLIETSLGGVRLTASGKDFVSGRSASNQADAVPAIFPGA